MSDDWIRIIPVDPYLAPDGEAKRPIAFVQRSYPDADDLRVVDTGKVEFFDAGANFESVGCPACQRGLDLGWWAYRLDLAYQTNFGVLNTTCLLCGDGCVV